MPPIPIQLAVQGGGAKLCALMAAMEAVQALEEEGVLKVTRLAGTSAGSIVASLFAAGHEMSVLRIRARDNPDRLRQAVPVHGSRFYSALKMLVGLPLWSMRPVQDILNGLFRDQQVSTFGDLRAKGRELLVVATDLTNGAVRVYSSDTDLVVPSVLDSCALPFLFRGPAHRESGSLIVDGGICENFPVDRLLNEENAYGVTLGISFPAGQSGRTPDTVLSFSTALLRAAIDNGVRQAQFRLGPTRVFMARTSVDTFDFEEALDRGLGDSYDLIRREARDFFEKFAESQNRKSKPGTTAAVVRNWDEESAATLQQHADIYNAQHSGTKLKYDEVKMITRVNSLLSREDAEFEEKPDEVSYRFRFEPADEPVYCHRVAVVEESHMKFLETKRWVVRNARGESIRTIDLMARDAASSDLREYLLFFDPVLRPGSPDGPYTLSYVHRVAGLMRELADKGSDTLEIGLPRASGTVGRIILVALIPDAVPNVRMHAAENAPLGRPMTDAELDRHHIEIPSDCYALGWIGENVAADAIVGVELRRA